MLKTVIAAIATACVLLAPATVAREPEASWTAVADRLLQTPAESFAFNWGEGVQMMGMMHAARAAKDARYARYVETWAKFHEQKDAQTLLNIGPNQNARTRNGYCGHWSPGSAILYLYQDRPKPEHLKLAKEIAEFIRTGAERSPDGGLGHWIGSHQLWVDTLYMACPLLSALGKMEKKPEYIDDAANQIIVHTRHLQDAKTGLIYHMWDWQAGTHSEGYWGRGNGWVLMSLAETMEVLDRRQPKYKELETIARNLARGLASTQDSEGLWHTVLDDPSTYPEASATSMFSYGLLKLIRLQVLPSRYRANAMKAWRAINERYVKDGVVTGVSGGTGPAGAAAYGRIKVGSETWGTGAYLLAATEISRE